MIKPSILLVDDNRTILNVFTWQLKAVDFSVTAVSSGSHALSTLQKKKFDLVITDLIMEGGDGFEVLMTVKKMTPLTPVVIISGHGEASIDAFHHGADDFLVKPFEIEELILKIRYLLNGNLPHLMISPPPLKKSRSSERYLDH